MTYVSNLLYGVSLRQNYRGRIIYKEIQIFPEVYIYQKVGNILKIDSAMTGNMEENIGVNKEGKDIKIGFNPKFFMDALRVIDEEEVTLYMVNPKAPCFVKDEDESFIYLILPVNFSQNS